MGVQDIYQSLTVTEKVLVKNIKRFTIRGKKGRAVPVIFTKEMQRNTDVIRVKEMYWFFKSLSFCEPTYR